MSVSSPNRICQEVFKLKFVRGISEALGIPKHRVKVLRVRSLGKVGKVGTVFEGLVGGKVVVGWCGKWGKDKKIEIA